MIKKVLIAEDHQIVNISLQKTLEEMGIEDLQQAAYCDDALSLIDRAVKNINSFDLLITDLYFQEDGVKQEIPGGAELITAVREVQIDLKILVFTADDKAAVIEKLFNQEVDGYVRKARIDARELKAAIEAIDQNQRHFPRQLMQGVKHKNTHSFTDHDIAIITLLSEGVLQKEIPAILKQKQLSPSGLSSIEKRLNLIKETLRKSSTNELIAFCKGNGII